MKARKMRMKKRSPKQLQMNKKRLLVGVVGLTPTGNQDHKEDLVEEEGGQLV